MAALLAGAGPAPAADPVSGAWVEGHAARARLVPGPQLSTGERVIGVQIELDPGWHTYWRNPGDSGAPPLFDFSQSANLAAATPEYPAPAAIPDAYGVSIGYHDEVVFPVVIEPVDHGSPTDLVLDLDYAVCLDICVPQSARLGLDLDPEGEPDHSAVSLVDAYRARVPRPQGDEAMPPMIEWGRLDVVAGVVVLTVSARGEGPAELFVEGPPAYYFAVPDAEFRASDGQLEFAVEVDGAKSPGDLSGASLRATLVAADGAVEYSWTID